MVSFQPFLMERMMSRFEQTVEYNLSESGVHPLRLRELLEDRPDSLEDLLSTSLNYPHVNGTPELRENIAALYPGARPENVLVTVGAIEANYVSVRALLTAGQELVVMLPNYMQIWGLAVNHGYNLKTFHLREAEGWAPDIAELQAVLSSATRLIAVCSPNNPTGRALTENEIDAIVTSAEKVGAWILADEVYRGAERTADEESPSFYDRYDKVLAVGSMSKAYGLPGLRIGWVVGPPEVIDDIWARHEYVAISATALSNRLATLALSPEIRPRLLQRARNYIRRGYPVLQDWLDAHPGVFSVRAPDAAAIAFVRYQLDVNSTAFGERLCREKSVLIVPGDHFGMDHHLRVSFGLPSDYLVPALDRVHQLVSEYL